VTDGYYPVDPSPVTVTPYVDPAGRSHFDVDITIPQNPSNGGLVALGTVALGIGLFLIWRGARPAPEPLPEPEGYLAAPTPLDHWPPDE
jgi:hypothetical protein